jgi:hypothetical protein
MKRTPTVHATVRGGAVKKFLIGMGVAGVAFLAAAGSSSAAPPQLLSVGQTGGHLTATWSLPAGVQAVTIEAAVSPLVLSIDGGFFPRMNRRLGESLEVAQTSFVSDSQLVPGTYYVHVAGHDSACPSCSFYEFTQILTVVIPSTPPPPQQPPPPPSSADTKAPQVKARLSAGVRGKVVHLGYTVSDNSGKTREQIAIYHGTKRIGNVLSRPLGTRKAGHVYTVAWRAASNAPSNLRFCVRAWDPSANPSAQSCAGIRLS